MNEPITLWDNIAGLFELKVTWTPFQLFALILLTFAFHFYAFPGRRGIREGMVIILGAHYLVINQICWLYFMMTNTLDGGLQIFNFGLKPFAPAFSFYLGVIVLVSLICLAGHIIKNRKDYNPRRLTSALLACSLLMFGVAVSARSPIVIQSLIDSIEAQDNS